MLSETVARTLPRTSCTLSDEEVVCGRPEQNVPLLLLLRRPAFSNRRYIQRLRGQIGQVSEGKANRRR